MIRASVALVTIGVVLFAQTSQAQVKKPNPNRLHQLYDLKTASLSIGAKRLTVWLADTASKRQEGLMFVKAAEMPRDGAMLFIFDSEQVRSFWMKNTLIHLDIAYLDRNGKVVKVAQMKAKDESGTPSGKPAMYVLEMGQGAMARWKIKPGLVISIPSNLRAR